MNGLPARELLSWKKLLACAGSAQEQGRAAESGNGLGQGDLLVQRGATVNDAAKRWLFGERRGYATYALIGALSVLRQESLPIQTGIDRFQALLFRGLDPPFPFQPSAERPAPVEVVVDGR